MECSALIEIGRNATLEASKALSKFVNAPISLGTIRADFQKKIEVPVPSGNTPLEPIYAALSSIVGDAKGKAMLCVPLRTACGLCDVLFKRRPDTTRAIGADEKDALLELANIVIGNYLRSFVRAMPETTLIHQTAHILCDTPANLTSQLSVGWGTPDSKDTCLFEVMFNFRNSSLGGSVIVVLEAGRIKCILKDTMLAR